jgi:hypothetical protein
MDYSSFSSIGALGELFVFLPVSVLWRTRWAVIFSRLLKLAKLVIVVEII